MRVGFIGAGNMAHAILSGIAKSKVLNCKDIFISNRSKEKLDDLKVTFGFNVSTDNSYVIKNAKDFLFIGIWYYIKRFEKKYRQKTISSINYGW